jgi:hypothetical protein
MVKNVEMAYVVKDGVVGEMMFGMIFFILRSTVGVYHGSRFECGYG